MGYMCVLMHVNTDILHTYMKTSATHTHMHSQTHALIHTHKHTGMHAHTPLMRMEILLSLGCHPRLYPCHQLSQKVKSLKFCLSSCLDAGQCQAVKQSNTVSSQHHFSPSLFSYSLHHYFPSPLIPLFLSSFNWTFAYRWRPESSFLIRVYDVQTYCSTEGELSSACAQCENVKC